MELCLDTIGNKRIDGIIGSDCRAGAGLSTEDGAKWGSGCNLSGKLDGLSHQRNVGGVRQASGVEGGGVKGIVGGDV